MADTMPQEAAANIAAAWTQFMSMATAQGATREELALASVETCTAILTTTRDAMWPEDSTPEGEEFLRRRLLHALDGAVRAVAGRGIPQREDEQPPE